MAGNKLNQSTSYSLRLTIDDRPYSKDLKDLFATLIVSLLPLASHRVRFTRVEYTFLTEDAIKNLGSLKFSQSNCIADPRQPFNYITTTATTTFSMAKVVGIALCQRFLDARFIESADAKREPVFGQKGMVWRLTPKGITILDRFCLRSGIYHKQVNELTRCWATPLMSLERNTLSDRLFLDQGTIEAIFCRFAGADRDHKALITGSTSSLDSSNGVSGVRMAEHRIDGRLYLDSFTGAAAVDWIMDNTTVIDMQEAIEMVTYFVKHDLMEPILQDRGFMFQNPVCRLFQPTKIAVYTISQRGECLVMSCMSGCASPVSDTTSVRRQHQQQQQQPCFTKDSNSQRLDKILNDPTLRLLFRENLRERHCEENLSFHQDVSVFLRSCRKTVRALDPDNVDSLNKAKEILGQAYAIYNAFLAPGSPRELNIEDALRKGLARRMTKAIVTDSTMVDTLREVIYLFEDAQAAVVQLVASDSVPKFIHNPKYEYPLMQAGVH